VKVSSSTTVKDLALQNDQVVTTMAGLVKGAETTDIRFTQDGGCSVTMQVNLGDVLRTITRAANGKSSVEDSIQQEILSETGNGAPPTANAGGTLEPALEVPQQPGVTSSPSPVEVDESILQGLLSGPEGVGAPQYESGRLARLFIVVHVPLDTSSSPQFAKAAARQVASARAQASFIKFLKSNVAVVEKGEQVYLVEARGRGDGAGASGVEKSTFSSSGSSLTSVQAEGFARGIIARKEVVQDGTLVSIYGWSHRLAVGARSAESSINSGQITVEQDFRRMLNGESGKK
jgi:hypothetical protein